jgi:hypothetical protein
MKLKVWEILHIMKDIMNGHRGIHYFSNLYCLVFMMVKSWSYQNRILMNYYSACDYAEENKIKDSLMQ